MRSEVGVDDRVVLGEPPGQGLGDDLAWAMTTTQSLMSRMTSMSCSTKTTDTRRRGCPDVFEQALRQRGFTPAIGSSSITILGSVISARAISRSLRCRPRATRRDRRPWRRA